MHAILAAQIRHQCSILSRTLSPISPLAILLSICSCTRSGLSSLHLIIRLGRLQRAFCCTSILLVTIHFSVTMPDSSSNSVIGVSASSTLHEKPIDDDVDVDRHSSHVNADVEKEAQVSEEQQELDPNVVDWDGPDDPAKGVNWPIKKKWRIVLLVSIFTFISYGHSEISSCWIKF